MVNLKKFIYPSVLLFAFALLFSLKGLFQWDFKIISSLALTGTIAVVAGLELILPYRKSWNKDHGDRNKDFLFTLILFPVIVAFCQGLVQSMPTSYKVIDLSAQSSFVQFLFILLTAEFLFYWLHRSFHEHAHLWIIHRRHHSVRRVYWMNAGTFNPVDLFLNFLIYCLPVAFINTDPMVFEYVLYFSATTGLMEHANVDFRAGTLNYLFNTAELHRWHHSVVVEESQTNYGKALSLFDGIFGTLKIAKGEHVTQVGIEK